MKITLIDGFIEPIASIREWMHHESDSETVNFLLNAMMNGWKLPPTQHLEKVEDTTGQMEIEIRGRFAQLIESIAAEKGQDPTGIAGMMIRDAISIFFMNQTKQPKRGFSKASR